MLKIKDNVDLKELEKFGYIYKENEISHARKRYELADDFDVYIYIEDRILHFNRFNSNNQTDTLYDLIKADLVEKVGEIE